ncbi:MAG: hypothetical protein QOC75_4931, partial [Pseudonocardiales bacterium]|nr:hypothetical protein [Pseudonocardiales bacterium]
MSVPLVLHLYGPVRVTHHGQVLPLGGPRECSVLGALAMAPGRPVSVERLIAWLWGEAPPARARKSVQNAVMLLRRALAPVGISVERTGAAYLLRLGECVLDTADPGSGEPLEQAGEGEVVDAARARLAELRLAAVERQLAQRLVFEPRDVAGELEVL